MRNWGFVICLFIFQQTAFAQINNPAFEAISKADFNSFSNLLDHKLEYSYNGKVYFMEKSEVIKALKSFMESNPLKNLTPKHNGSSKSKESQYHIAHYISTNGKTYRILIYSEGELGVGQIQELKIDSL